MRLTKAELKSRKRLYQKRVGEILAIHATGGGAALVEEMKKVYPGVAFSSHFSDREMISSLLMDALDKMLPEFELN